MAPWSPPPRRTPRTWPCAMVASWRSARQANSAPRRARCTRCSMPAGATSLSQLVRATSEGPARTWDLFPRKGAIAVGSDADLTIVDLDVVDTIAENRLHGKNNHTPFEGYPTRGA